MNLDFVHIECEIIADTPTQLTAILYNALRSFEEHFKASCCLHDNKSCKNCSKQIGCPYRIIFAQGLSSDPVIVRLHQKPSLPYSLYISSVDGDALTCTIGIVVIGSAVNFIDIFHTALFRLVEISVSEVLSNNNYTVSTYGLDYQGIRHEITHHTSLSETVILLSARHILQSTAGFGSLRLTLKSPLRLLCNGSIMHYFDFAMFFRSQLRRCSSLYAYYGTGELNLDFTQISCAAQQVTASDDKTKFSQPQWSKLMNRAGLTGIVECVGLVEPMFSLLLLGSYFNAGKGATFGSGFYQIELID